MLKSRGLARPIAAVAAAFAVACWVALDSYRVEFNVEGALERGGREPSAAAIVHTAEGRTAAAIAALSDRSLEPAARLAGYRAHLEVAEQLFVAALRVRPTDAVTRVRLAAVRSELDDPAEKLAGVSALLTDAEALAPGRAHVHEALAELRLDLGQRDRGLAHLRRAIALDAGLAKPAFDALSRRGYSPQEIASLVPPEAAHLASLANLYFERGVEIDYIDLVEPVLASEPDPTLVAHWAHAHRRARLWSRLESSLTTMLDGDTRFERAQLRLERSRARMALGLVQGAHEDAEAAFDLDPLSAVVAEQLGITALQAGAPQRALVGFGAALDRAVRASADTGTRARLYRGVGQSEELLGHFDRAHEAYRHALDLVPREPTTLAKMLELERRASRPRVR